MEGLTERELRLKYASFIVTSREMVKAIREALNDLSSKLHFLERGIESVRNDLYQLAFSLAEYERAINEKIKKE
jgi:hypothetical protein